MAVITPLYPLDVPKWKGVIKGLEGQASSTAKLGSPKVPGVPNIPELARKFLKKIGKVLADNAKVIILALLVLLIAGAIANNMDTINKMIDKLNILLEKVESALQIMADFCKPIFPVVKVITVAMIVAKVITMIPSFGGGMGAVVVATFPGQVAQAVYTFCVAVMDQIKPIPFSVIAIMNYMLSIFALLSLIMAFLMQFASKQEVAKSAAVEASLKTADDWAASTTSEEDSKTEDDSLGRGKETLSMMDDINTINMFAGSSAAPAGSGMGGAITDNLENRLGISIQINTIDTQISNLNSKLENAITNGLSVTTGGAGDGTGGIGGNTSGAGSADGGVNDFGDGGASGMGTLNGTGGGSGDGSTVPSTNAGIDGGEGLVSCTLPDGSVQQLTIEDCLAASGTGVELVECTLPDGTVQMMTMQECAEAGGTWGGSGLGVDIEPNLCWGGCQHGIDGNNSSLLSCMFPDGVVRIVTLAECIAGNGGDASLTNLQDSINNLKLVKDEMENELEGLGGIPKEEEINNSNISAEDRETMNALYDQLGNVIITSLLHPNQDVTIDKATENTGKRYGFYQSDIK